MREIGGQGAGDPWAVQAHPDVPLLSLTPYEPHPMTAAREFGRCRG
jgi:hypothetical protein